MTAEPVSQQPSAVAATLPDAATLTSDAPAELALMASQKLFDSSPAIVLVDAEDDAALDLVDAVATAVVGPVLIIDGAIGPDGIRTEIERLGTQTAVAVGDVNTESVVPQAPGEDSGIEVIKVRASDAAGVPTGSAEVARLLANLPDPGEASLARESAVLVDSDDASDTRAALATAHAAGAVTIDVPGGDPRRDSATVQLFAQAQPLSVVALGAAFASPEVLAEQVRTASSGVQLPGGGQLVDDGRRFVGLYGTRISPSLGALGQQDMVATIERAGRVAATVPAGDVPATPTLEVLVTVASTVAGADGNHANEQDPQQVLEIAERAQAAGQYVVLAIQPGSATFVDQLQAYGDVLALPNVGVALETEWRFVTGSSPALSATIPVQEVTDVVNHVAGIVREGALPQKLLVIRDGAPSAVDGVERLSAASEVGIVIAGPAGREADQGGWGAATERMPMMGVTRWLQGADVPAVENPDVDQPAYVVYR